MILILALLIGVVAGLRTATPLAAVAWAAWLGRLSLAGGPLGFMGAPVTPWLFTLAAIAELVGDKLPKTPSRKAPALLIGRVIAGGLAGAALGAAHGALVGGLIAGAIGAVVGTFGGYAVRMRLAKAFGRDLPAALVEDAVAIVGSVLIVSAAV